MIILVPTVNDDKGDFGRLFKMKRMCERSEESIVFDFRNCQFLQQNAVAFLGGLSKWLDYKGKGHSFDWSSCSRNIRRNLEKNQLCSFLGEDVRAPSGITVPFRQDFGKDKNSIIEYLSKHWLRSEWLDVSVALRRRILSTMWETYENAFVHGSSPVGVFSCGQFYPSKNELKLCVVDFGTGIVQRVKDYFDSDLFSDFTSDIPSDTALEWAFTKGNSTQSHPGGLGLANIKRFVQLNEGKLQVFCNDARIEVTAERELYEMHNTFFRGTAVNITLNCDAGKNKYLLHGENDG